MSGILEVTIRFRRRVSSLSSRVESDDAVEGVDVEVVGEGVELSSMGDVRGVGARLSLGPNERSIGPREKQSTCGLPIPRPNGRFADIALSLQ